MYLTTWRIENKAYKYGDFDMDLYFNKAFSNSVNRLEMEITESAYVHGDKGWNLENICSPFTRFYYFESGSAQMTVDGQDVTLTPGYIYIIPPGVSLSSSCDGTFTKLYFHFNITRPDGYDLFAGCRGLLMDFVGHEHIAKIKSLFFSDKLVDTLKLRNDILHYALSLFPEKNANSITSVIYSPQVQSAIDYIKQHLSIQLSVKLLSDKLFVAPTTLSKHFREEVGVNIGEYIDDIVFENAKKMLLKTDLPISTISEKYGFCDRFYFSRRFKEKFGVTPFKFRKMKL